jgi:hypothetical protein
MADNLLARILPCSFVHESSSQGHVCTGTSPLSKNTNFLFKTFKINC